MGGTAEYAGFQPKKLGLYIQSNHAPGLSQAAPRPQRDATHDATHAAAHPSPWALTLLPPYAHTTHARHTPSIGPTPQPTVSEHGQASTFVPYQRP